MIAALALLVQSHVFSDPNKPKAELLGAPVSEMDARASDALLARYADCVVSNGRARKKVKAFLRTPPNSAAWFRAGADVTDGECLTKVDTSPRPNTNLQMRLAFPTLPAAFYPALYRREFGKTTPPVPGPETPILIADEFDTAPAELLAVWRGQRALGDCIVRQTPSGAHMMIVNMPWSAGEDAAMPAVVGALKNCLTAEQTVRLSRNDVRGLVGEALYKIAITAVPSGSGAAGTN